MSKRPLVVRVPIITRVITFLAINPTEELRTADIVDKFAVTPYDFSGVRNALQPWVEIGWLVKTKHQGHRHDRYTTYSAGPEILKQIPVMPPTVRENWDQRMERYPD